MSTVDPRIARAQRQEQEAASPTRKLADGGVVLLHAAFWVLAGFGFVFMYDTMRLMSTNQVGDGWTSRFESSGLEFLSMVGITLGSIFGFFVTSRLAHRGIGVASAVPIATGLLGTAVGMLIGLPNWTPPQLLGEKNGFFDGDPREPWGFGEWVAYFLPYWLPSLLALLGMAVVVLAFALSARGRRKSEHMAELMQRATKTRGVVTEAIATGTEIQGMPRIQFTVKFTDNSGVERWVTKKGQFMPASIPRAGDAAVVWFDPLDPGTEKSIMVGIGPEAEQVASS